MRIKKLPAVKPITTDLKKWAIYYLRTMAIRNHGFRYESEFCARLGVGHQTWETWKVGQIKTHLFLPLVDYWLREPALQHLSPMTHDIFGLRLQEIMDHYALVDQDVADCLGCSWGTVYAWRKVSRYVRRKPTGNVGKATLEFLRRCSRREPLMVTGMVARVLSGPEAHLAWDGDDDIEMDELPRLLPYNPTLEEIIDALE